MATQQEITERRKEVQELTRRGWKLGELARALECTERTVERDLAALRDAGADLTPYRRVPQIPRGDAIPPEYPGPTMILHIGRASRRRFRGLRRS